MDDFPGGSAASEYDVLQNDDIAGQTGSEVVLLPYTPFVFGLPMLISSSKCNGTPNPNNTQDNAHHHE